MRFLGIIVNENHYIDKAEEEEEMSDQGENQEYNSSNDGSYGNYGSESDGEYG